MNEYVKPEIMVIEGISEGVYAASGDNEEPKKCRFGREYASPTADICQGCCKTGGKVGTGKDENGNECYRKDYTYCIDGMPERTESK